MDQSDIKALSPTECPHCHGEIVIEFKSTAPQVTAVFTPQDINTAKETTIQRVHLLPLSEDKKKQVLDWLRDENTIFSPNDVNTIITSVIDENDITKTDTAA